MLKKRGKVPKIPKELRNLDARGIELRYGLNPREFFLGHTPFYKINSLSGGKSQPVGSVSVLGSDGEYFVKYWFDSVGGTEKVGKRKSLEEANLLAYKAAVKIADRIAEHNNLPLEDLAMADQKAFEEEHLKIEIDSLKPWVFLFLIFGGLILSISSLTITGNAVSNITGTTPGILGGVTFYCWIGRNGFSF